MGKELEELKERLKVKIHLIYSEQHSKKYQIGKHLATTHNKMAIEMNRYLQETDITKWMTKAKNHSDPKRPPKKKPPKNNYRLIMCLLMMWKILMAQIREHRLFLEEWKGCHQGTRRTGVH